MAKTSILKQTKEKEMNNEDIRHEITAKMIERMDISNERISNMNKKLFDLVGIINTFSATIDTHKILIKQLQERVLNGISNM